MENNYKIKTDNYIECEILPTDEPHDGIYIFNTFTDAKSKYL